MIWVRIVILASALLGLVVWAVSSLMVWLTSPLPPVDLDAAGWVDRSGRLKSSRTPGGVRKRYVPGR